MEHGSTFESVENVEFKKMERIDIPAIYEQFKRATKLEFIKNLSSSQTKYTLFELNVVHAAVIKAQKITSNLITST